MVFRSPDWVPKVPEIPDTAPLCDFMLDEKYGRYPIAKSRDPYTCGLSGATYSTQEVKQRVDHLSRSIAKELDWKVNEGSELDKVVGIFAFNTVDVMPLTWAIHRLNGVSSPANAAYSAMELTYQLSNSGAKALFTILPLLPIAVEAAAAAGIPEEHVYVCALPDQLTWGAEPERHKTLNELVEEGASLPELEPINWSKGQGRRQTAFLCYSSGTSGLPKGVMITHYNVITNVLQITTYDKTWRHAISSDYTDIALGLLPQSHIYGLVVVSLTSTYRGDQVIVLPKFELQQYLESIARYKIRTLYIVPPIMIAMVKNKPLLDKYDLSSVYSIFTGAAPLGRETAEMLQKQYPKWIVRQGYGLTETCTLVTATAPTDVWFGSSGSLIAGMEAKLVSIEGVEITGYDQAGELWVKSPSVVPGYLKNDKATMETFVEDSDGRFMRTGDEVMFRVSPAGTEHIWVVDRIKELIKVKGLQVAPAELEACLLEHPAVGDCTVISVPDERAGELPKAYVVKAAGLKGDDEEIKRAIQKHVEENKARHKWLKGGVEFIDLIPKTASGKILRRFLRDKDRADRKKGAARL